MKYLKSTGALQFRTVLSDSSELTFKYGYAVVSEKQATLAEVETAFEECEEAEYLAVLEANTPVIAVPNAAVTNLLLGREPGIYDSEPAQGAAAPSTTVTPDVVTGIVGTTTPSALASLLAKPASQ